MYSDARNGIQKSKGESLHRNKKAMQRAISEKTIKGDEGTKRCFGSAQHDKGSKDARGIVIPN
jgi:hypothetical protein